MLLQGLKIFEVTEFNVFYIYFKITEFNIFIHRTTWLKRIEDYILVCIKIDIAQKKRKENIYVVSSSV